MAGDIKSSLYQFTISESNAFCVISKFVPQKENNITSMVEFQLFGMLLANHIVFVYAIEKYYPKCIIF